MEQPQHERVPAKTETKDSESETRCPILRDCLIIDGNNCPIGDEYVVPTGITHGHSSKTAQTIKGGNSNSNVKTSEAAKAAQSNTPTKRKPVIVLKGKGKQTFRGKRGGGKKKKTGRKQKQKQKPNPPKTKDTTEPIEAGDSNSNVPKGTRPVIKSKGIYRAFALYCAANELTKVTLFKNAFSTKGRMALNEVAPKITVRESTKGGGFSFFQAVPGFSDTTGDRKWIVITDSLANTSVEPFSFTTREDRWEMRDGVTIQMSRANWKDSLFCGVTCFAENYFLIGFGSHVRPVRNPVFGLDDRVFELCIPTIDPGAMSKLTLETFQGRHQKYLDYYQWVDSCLGLPTNSVMDHLRKKFITHSSTLEKKLLNKRAAEKGESLYRKVELDEYTGILLGRRVNLGELIVLTMYNIWVRLKPILTSVAKALGGLINTAKTWFSAPSEDRRDGLPRVEYVEGNEPLPRQDLVIESDDFDYSTYTEEEEEEYESSKGKDELSSSSDDEGPSFLPMNLYNAIRRRYITTMAPLRRGLNDVKRPWARRLEKVLQPNKMTRKQAVAMLLSHFSEDVVVCLLPPMGVVIPVVEKLLEINSFAALRSAAFWKDLLLAAAKGAFWMVIPRPLKIVYHAVIFLGSLRHTNFMRHWRGDMYTQSSFFGLQEDLAVFDDEVGYVEPADFFVETHQCDETIQRAYMTRIKAPEQNQVRELGKRWQRWNSC